MDTHSSTTAPATAPTTLTFAEVGDFVGQMFERFEQWARSPSTAAGADGRRRLDVDLAPLTRFDSSAIAAMVALAKRAGERNVELRFLNAAPNLRKLASLYAVDTLLFGN